MAQKQKVEALDQVYVERRFVVWAAEIMGGGRHYSGLPFLVKVHLRPEGYWLPKMLMVVHVGVEVPGVQARYLGTGKTGSVQLSVVSWNHTLYHAKNSHESAVDHPCCQSLEKNLVAGWGTATMSRLSSLVRMQGDQNAWKRQQR